MQYLNNIRKLVGYLEPHICDCCGKIHYSAKEVCELLRIEDVERALNELDPVMTSEMYNHEDKEDWDLAESEKIDVVTLEGVFALVFKSQSSFAKQIQRWIIAEFVEKLLSDEDESEDLELFPAEVAC